MKRLALDPFKHKHDFARSPSIGQDSPSHTHTNLKFVFSWATRASDSLFLFRFIFFICMFIFCFALNLHVPLDQRSTYRTLCIGSVDLCLHLSSWTLGGKHSNNTCDHIYFQNPLSRPVANSCRRADVNQPLKLPRQPTPPMALTAHRRINNNTLCIHHATPAPAGSTTAKRHGVAKTSTGSSQSLWQPLGNTTRTMLPKSKCEILDDHFSIQDVGHRPSQITPNR